MDMKVNHESNSIAKRNVNLDFLRMMACLAVVCMHTASPNLNINIIIAFICTFAIPMFFASSGFILLQRKEVTNEYIFKKVICVVRIIFIWSLLVESLIVIAKVALGIDISYVEIIKEITYYPLIQRGNMSHFWYLGALSLLYLVLPMIRRLINGSKKNLLCVWLSFAAICIGIQCIALQLGRPIQKDIRQTFRLWTWIQYFLCGGGISYLIYSKKKRVSFKLHGMITFVLTLFAVIIQVYCENAFIHDTHPEFYYDDMIIIIWVISLMSFTLRIKLSATVIRIVEFFSPLIMGVYIIHPLINRVGFHFLNIDTMFTQIAYTLIVILSSLGSAYMINKMPFGKLLLRI